MIWLIGLGVWTAVSVAVGLVLGPALKRSQEPPGSSEEETPEVPFRIETARRIEHDGSRRLIAAGTYPQRGEAGRKADEALLGDLADALEERQAAEPVARAARRAWPGKAAS